MSVRYTPTIYYRPFENGPDYVLPLLEAGKVGLIAGAGVDPEAVSAWALQASMDVAGAKTMGMFHEGKVAFITTPDRQDRAQARVENQQIRDQLPEPIDRAVTENLFVAALSEEEIGLDEESRRVITAKAQGMRLVVIDAPERFVSRSMVDELVAFLGGVAAQAGCAILLVVANDNQPQGGWLGRMVPMKRSEANGFQVEEGQIDSFLKLEVMANGHAGPPAIDYWYRWGADAYFMPVTEPKPRFEFDKPADRLTHWLDGNGIKPESRDKLLDILVDLVNEEGGRVWSRAADLVDEFCPDSAEKKRLLRQVANEKIAAEWGLPRQGGQSAEHE